MDLSRIHLAVPLKTFLENKIKEAPSENRSTQSVPKNLNPT